MRKLAGVLAAVLALAVMMLSHGARTTEARAEKQLICHVSDESGAHIIEVALPAVPAHLANHGDCIINSTNRDLIGEPCNPTDANGNDVCDVQPL